MKLADLSPPLYLTAVKQFDNQCRLTTIELHEASAEQLSALCDNFRRAVFKAAKKTDPKHHQPID